MEDEEIFEEDVAIEDEPVEDDVIEEEPDAEQEDEQVPEIPIPEEPPAPSHSDGEIAYSSEIGDDLLCPSQVYEYVELVDSEQGTVRFVGYDDFDTYEDDLDDAMLDELFGKPVDDRMEFDESRAARMFL